LKISLTKIKGSSNNKLRWQCGLRLVAMEEAKQ